jgi:hypothetical protein
MTEVAVAQVADPIRRARQALIAVQAFIWVCYFIGVGLLLTVAMVKNGGLNFYPFAHADMEDPKDVLGLGFYGNLLHIPLMLVVIFGGFPGALAALAGLGTLAASKPSRTWPLIVSTALTVAFVIVQLTPFGALVREWVLD